MKRHRLSRVLAFVLSLMLIWTAFPANVFAGLLPESEWHDGPVWEIYGNQQVDNPFPEYFPNEEVEKMAAKDFARPKLIFPLPFIKLAEWSGRKGYDTKIYIQRKDGTMEPQGFVEVSEDPNDLSGSPTVHIGRAEPGDKLGYYTVLYGDMDNAAVHSFDSQFIQKVYTFVYSKHPDPNGGDLGLAIKMTRQWIPTRAEANGEVVFEQKDEPNIRVNKLSKKTYLHFMTTQPLPENMAYLNWYFNLNRMAAGQGGVVRNMPVLKMQYIYPQVTFHYVMDRPYRQLNQMKGTDPILGRNHGQLIYANKAIDPMDGLKELTKSHVTTCIHFDNEQDNPKWAGTMIRPTGGDPKDYRYSYYETDPETKELLDGEDGTEAKERLTYAQLAAAVTEDENNILVNVGNDIDWPAEVATTGENAYVLDGTKASENGKQRGNHLIAPAVDDEGHMRLMKHYYLTYREMPASVELEKTDATTANQDVPKKLEGATFSLYRAPETTADEPKLIAENLTTDADGKLTIGTPKTKEELTALVKDNEWLGAYVDTGVYKKAGATTAADIYLIPGDYILRETKAPVGYKLPTGDAADVKFTVKKPTFAEDGTVETQKVSVTNEPQTYPVPFELTKTGKDDAALEGAVFTLYKGEVGNDETVIAENLTTDQNGKLTIGEISDMAGYDALLSDKGAANAMTDGYFTVNGKLYLMPGKYHLVETAAPVGYKKLNTPVAFELKEVAFDAETGKAVLQTATAKDEMYVYPVPFELTKTDAKTGKGLAEATFALYKGEAGAEPEVKIAEGLKTDANGKLTIGEVLDRAGYEKILGSPDAEKAETDGYFTVDGKLYLMPGKYHLVETAAPVGYKKLEAPVAFELKEAAFDAETGKAVLQTATAKDEAYVYPVPFELTKTDAKTGKGLAEATFTLYKGAAGTAPEVKIAEGLKTDANGKLTIGEALDRAGYEKILGSPDAEKAETDGYFTFDGKLYLMPGQYHLVETAAPVGYKKLTEPVAFELKATEFDAETGEASLQTATAADEPYIYPAVFRLTKTRKKDPAVTLQGATFTLYKGEAGTQPEVKIAEGLTTDESGLITIGEVTDRAGYEAVLNDPAAANAETDGYFTVDGKLYLMPGKYHLVETKAPIGYKALTEPVAVELTEPAFDETTGQATLQAITVANEVYEYPAPFELTKTDAEDAQKVLEGATFTLYKGEVGAEPEVKIAEGLKTDVNGKLTIGEALDRAGYEKILGSPDAEKAKTDGYFTFDGKLYLMPGQYHLVETAAPEGYEKLSEPFGFELKATKFDDASGKAVVQTATVQDKKVVVPEPELTYPVPFELTKTDADDAQKLLEGATFTLYKGEVGADPEVKIAEGLTTDGNGKLTIGEVADEATYKSLLKNPAAKDAEKDGYFTVDGKLYLMPGNYHLVETKAPEGYEKLNAPVAFELKETAFDDASGKALLQTATVQNKKSEPPTPPTPPEPELTYPAPFELTKTDADDGAKVLEGATFTLYKDATGADPEVKIAEGLTTDGNGKLTIGAVADEETYKALLKNPAAKNAEKDGYFTVDGKLYLMPGKYHLVETKAPEGYEKLTAPVAFELTKTAFDDASGQALLQTTTVQNKKNVTPEPPTPPTPPVTEQKYPAPLQVVKTDAGSGRILPGAVFTLYQGAPGAAKKVKIAEGLKTDGKGRFIIGEALNEAAYKALMENPKAVAGVKKGYFTIDGKLYLMPGQYHLVETKAPAGYQKLKAPVGVTLMKTSFDQKTGKALLQTVTVQNKKNETPKPPTPPTPKPPTPKPPTPKPPTPTPPTPERVYPVPVLLTKLDAKDVKHVLEGAVFTLYRDEAGAKSPVKVAEGLKTDRFGHIMIGEILTKTAYEELLNNPAAVRADEDGYFTVDGRLYLMPGQYHLVETEAPAGYKKLTEPIGFELKEAEFDAEGDALPFILNVTNIPEPRKNPSGSSKEEQKGKKEDSKKMPESGAESTLPMFGMLMGLSIIAAAVVVFRKGSHKE